MHICLHVSPSPSVIFPFLSIFSPSVLFPSPGQEGEGAGGPEKRPESLRGVGRRERETGEQEEGRGKEEEPTEGEETQGGHCRETGIRGPAFNFDSHAPKFQYTKFFKRNVAVYNCKG